MADDSGGVVGDGTTRAYRLDVKRVGALWFAKDTS